MNMTNVYSTDEIRKAVKEIKKIKPGYSLMLDLYEEIYIAQEESKNGIHLEDYKMSGETLSLKLKNQFPLVNISQFVIDKKNSEMLFKRLCGILANTESELTEPVKKIIDIIENNNASTDKLFSAFLGEDESLFDSIENEFQINKKILGYIIYNSIKPSIVIFSQKMSEYLDKENGWDKGCCPVCGSAPELSVFEENGKRFMICGFCNHKWASKRIYCPFCENTDHNTLKYFEIEDEEEYRVDVCGICKKYIKTVDLTKTTRSVYPPLEFHSTPYIDLKFNEMGFNPGYVKSE